MGASAKKRTWQLGERPLRQGASGPDVKALQRFLTRAGQATGVDGQFGRGTKRAVRAFERSQRRRVDGVVTPLDVRVLRDVAINGGAVATAANTRWRATGRATTPGQPTGPPPGSRVPFRIRGRRTHRRAIRPRRGGCGAATSIPTAHSLAHGHRHDVGACTCCRQGGAEASAHRRRFCRVTPAMRH
ncbi:MAG: peptidoglycan-binding protein [Actinobacteria bacterium]|nr:peptidoglycan-binding protein [Actinomycetota bacterium]